MEVIKNRPLLERKQFLMRAVYNDNMPEADANKEIAELDAQILENLEEAIREQEEANQQELKSIQKVQIKDGDLKRSVANLLIKFLQDSFSDDEIKGIFRQGYKIQRGQ